MDIRNYKHYNTLPLYVLDVHTMYSMYSTYKVTLVRPQFLSASNHQLTHMWISMLKNLFVILFFVFCSILNKRIRIFRDGVDEVPIIYSIEELSMKKAYPGSERGSFYQGGGSFNREKGSFFQGTGSFYREWVILLSDIMI